MAIGAEKFWETKSLAELNEEEWELICDHCGRCCLHKIKDDESGEVFFTCIACKLHDLENGGCRDYEHRKQIVPECVVLSAKRVAELDGLPKTCAYRLLHERKLLPRWHPLVSGSKKSVMEAGISIDLFAISETAIDLDHLHEFVLDRGL